MHHSHSPLYFDDDDDEQQQMSTVFSPSSSLMKFIQTLHEANKMLNLVNKFKQVQIMRVPVLLHRVRHSHFHVHLRLVVVFIGFKFERICERWPNFDVCNYEILDTRTTAFDKIGVGLFSLWRLAQYSCPFFS